MSLSSNLIATPSQLPAGLLGPVERPTVFADEVGQRYASERSDEFRKTHGLFLTPPSVASFMADMLTTRPVVRLLDPAAGAGVLLCAAVESLVESVRPPQAVEIVAYEIDQELALHLRKVLDLLGEWARQRGVRFQADVLQQDFILSHGRSLDTQTSLFGGEEGQVEFDVVIANPPYFKIGKDDPRALAAQTVVHGQPNIYGLFMAVSAALLAPGGEMVVICPRSFASGPYFRRFREQFFAGMRPLRTHVFASRREAFGRDEVLQENVILHAACDPEWSKEARARDIVISTSAGIADLDQPEIRTVALSDVLDLKHSGGVFRLPAAREDQAILGQLDQWTGRLRGHGLEVSTGPVVAFRATDYLAQEANGITVPLLWMNHVKAMRVEWPTNIRKPQWIDHKAESRRLLVPRANYVLLRRFSAKEERRRLTAAPLLANQIDSDMIGFENHLNYIYRPGGSLTEDETWGLAALLNSAIYDSYFRSISGNTQVGATELRAMPLPPLDAIRGLGAKVRQEPESSGLIEALVSELVEGSIL